MVCSPSQPIDSCGAFACAQQQSKFLHFHEVTSRLAHAYADSLGVVVRLKIMVGR